MKFEPPSNHSTYNKTKEYKYVGKQLLSMFVDANFT